MASVYPRGDKLWCRVKIDGTWCSRPTPYGLTDRHLAERFAVAAQYTLDTKSRSRLVTSGDLPTAARGAFGWAVHHDATTGRHRLLVHVADVPGGAICAPFHGSDARIVIPHKQLRRCPPGFEGPAPIAGVADVVYVVAVAPELRLSRVKIGWTSKIGERLATFATVAPTALLLGLWPGSEADEAAAHLIADGRIGSSEVFDCRDVWTTVTAIGRMMAGRSEFLGDVPP